MEHETITAPGLSRVMRELGGHGSGPHYIGHSDFSVVRLKSAFLFELSLPSLSETNVVSPPKQFFLSREVSLISNTPAIYMSGGKWGKESHGRSYSGSHHPP